mmetsp:Transcript_19951/g.29866  ORF Transcript_19951/g.29866 Transcript_19951/m.29866 type:complete len:493 (-) Transcript_19951:107-1585(-)
MYLKLITALLIVDVVAIPVGEGNTKSLDSHIEGDGPQELPYIDVTMDVNDDRLDNVKKQIENMGSWWVHLQDRLYSPIASSVNAQSKAISSLIDTGINSRLRKNSFLKQSESYYVAIGGSRKNLPEILAKNVVGSNGHYHIVYLPNISEEDKMEIHTLAAKASGSRMVFQQFFQMEPGFSPVMAYAVVNYTDPLNLHEQKQELEAMQELKIETITKYLQKLVAFGTRSALESNRDTVEKFLVETFENLGFLVCKQPVDIRGMSKAYNVIALAPGSLSDGKYVTIGAHYDSRPFSGTAPGAEDNGSGAAALLAIAEAYSKSKLRTKKTIVFAAFTGEEEGLLGSTAFVKASNNWGEMCGEQVDSQLLELTAMKATTSGAIIMDEVGWKSDKFEEHTVTLETRPFSGDVLKHLAHSSSIHNGDGLKILHSMNPFGSDHMPFLDSQQQAVLTINGDDERYPYYHTKEDTIDHVDFSLVHKIAKMNLAASYRLAQS